MDETLNRKGKSQFKIELALALIITGLACVAGFSNLFYFANSLYPSTADAMGHMAKVRYLADCLSKMEFPAWFPYWYNGSTVAQYYPPLSYWIMALIYIPVQNTMLTFKIYCFLMIFIGGLGVWYFCRAFIGKWCGLFGTIVFCIQPYILRSLFSAGTVAQGPIIALSSWYLITLLRFGQEPNRKYFFLSTLLCSLMILGHPNTAFMMVICIIAALLILVVVKQMRFLSFIYFSISIFFSGILTAFWSLVGATGFENPGIPYLLVEAALNYTANFKWYTTWSGSFFYFAIPISIGSLLAGMTLVYRVSKKKADWNEKYYVCFILTMFVLTVIFSFGLNLPLFEYLPLAESFVPGRILGLTSVAGAVLSSYLLREIAGAAAKKRISYRVLAVFLIIFLAGGSLYSMNPFKTQYYPIKNDSFNNMFSGIDFKGENFEKGRYTYIGVVDCSETYFPLSNDLNISDGWNIEGTPHNRAIWNFVIANPSGCFDYIAKNLAYWNVRYLLLNEEFMQVAQELADKYQFRFTAKRGGHSFYYSKVQSSYFLVDHRNALLFGAGAPGLAMEFPYLINEQRNSITDYSLKELKKYKLIYLCEPEVKTKQEKEAIEATVEELIDSGITVLIEPATAEGYALFDVTVADVALEDEPYIQKQPGSRINTGIEIIPIDESMKFGRAIFGLEDVYYKLSQNGGRLENDIIGAKKAGSGEVIFIGKHLSQYLKAVYSRNWGVPPDSTGYPECSDDVKALFEDIFSTYGVNKDFWPDPFPVKKADWNYKGVDFEYSSPTAKEMTVSVTYSPRWKATLDGKLIPVGQKENLITLDLPAGDHEVKLTYGLTKYGIAGYIISLLGLLIFILFLIFYDIIMYHFRQVCTKTSRFLQIGSDDQLKIN